ncbi:MAG: hypothetical protein IIU22_04250 [Firmicutes bacterium]|nr:hypothetical protein [Bacillota bacterium]MBQ5415373.1 hypothetical protein [Bacillota bacterium]
MAEANANKKNDRFGSAMFYILGTIVIVVALYGLVFWLVQTRDVNVEFTPQQIDGREYLVYSEETFIYSLTIRIDGRNAESVLVLKPIGIVKKRSMNYDPNEDERTLKYDVWPSLRLDALTIF